jgi:hypothetical protein
VMEGEPNEKICEYAAKPAVDSRSPNVGQNSRQISDHDLSPVFTTAFGHVVRSARFRINRTS